MSRSRSRRRSSTGSWVLIALFALALLAAIGGLIALYLLAVSNHERIDAALCPDTGPRGQTLVLVDTTDAFSAVTQAEISTWLKERAEQTSRGALFELRTLRADTPHTSTIFSLCNPGDGSDLSQLTANPAQALKLWREGFSGPLSSALQQVMGNAAADTSPIMAGIQQIAVDRLASAKFQFVPTKLIVVSDMLENTAYFSHYRDGDDFTAFERSEAATRFATSLAGANVELWLVRRPSTPVPSLDLIAFWTKWIAASGGQFERAKHLQGME